MISYINIYNYFQVPEYIWKYTLSSDSWEYIFSRFGITRSFPNRRNMWNSPLPLKKEEKFQTALGKRCFPKFFPNFFPNLAKNTVIYDKSCVHELLVLKNPWSTKFQCFQGWFWMSLRRRVPRAKALHSWRGTFHKYKRSLMAPFYIWIGLPIS